MDRILGLQGRIPLLANPNLQWVVDPMIRMTEVLNPPGYQVIPVGDRLALHRVSCQIQISSVFRTG